MTITSELQPYEILVRFEPDGTIRGAHCAILRVLKENGDHISSSEIISEIDLADPIKVELALLMATKMEP